MVYKIYLGLIVVFLVAGFTGVWVVLGGGVFASLLCLFFAQLLITGISFSLFDRVVGDLKKIRDRLEENNKGLDRLFELKKKEKSTSVVDLVKDASRH